MLIANLKKNNHNIPGSNSNKIDRHKYLNPRINENSHQFYPQRYSGLENNGSCAVLPFGETPKSKNEMINNPNYNKGENFDLQ